MIYGIDQNVLSSPYSLIISIFLCLGVFSLGNIIQYFVIRNKFFKNYNRVNYFFSPIIGTYFLILVLYYFVIFEINSKFIFIITSYLLLLLPFISSKELIKIYYLIKLQIIRRNNFLTYLLLTIYIVLFIIAASPINHADAIDYHFLGSLNILNLGHFQKQLLPMTNHLASLGDLIMSLGLALKAEQFSNLIQFLSLISLIPFFIDTEKRFFFLILILTCPITLVLISLHKPQLLFCVSSLLIFIFLIRYFKNFDTEDLKKIFPIILTILCINSLVKYTFHLSAFLLSFYFFYLMSKKKLFRYSLFVSIIIFSFLYLPYLVFRHQYFETGLIDLFSSPLPLNLYGFQSHHDLLSGGNLFYQDGKFSFINIFFPTNILAITTTYGPLIILIFLMINNKISNYQIPILLILIFFTCVFIFGSNIQRFLYEGFLWIVFLVSIIVNYKSYFYKIFSKIIYLQLLVMIPFYLFFVIKIFPGSLNSDYKKKIMSETANGYDLALWTNEVLNKDDVLLSSHRSISLFKNETYSPVFTWHVDLNNPRAKIYLDFLKSKKINRILIFEDKSYLFHKKNNYRTLDGLFKGCLGKKIFFNKRAGKNVGRNPFRSSKFYSASIYEFNYKKLPNCINS